MFGRMKRMIALGLCVMICSSTVFQNNLGTMTLHAATRTIRLAECRSLGVAHSETIRKTKSKIALKQASYKQAVKSSKMKVKNKRDIRWKPLFNLHLPEPLSLEEISNVTIKPAQIETEITGLRHVLTDAVYKSYEEVENLYTNCYVLQEKISFQKDRLETMKVTLKKNQARLRIGAANQSDVDAIEKSISTLEKSIAENERTFSKKKEKLGKAIHLDLSLNYRFANPFMKAEIPRSVLKDLVEVTLDRSQTYYEAKLATQQALLELEINYNNLKNKFGKKANLLVPYITQVKNGEAVDSEAFKQVYDRFLTQTDSPWSGSFRILFIRFSKEFLKGEVDGTRFVESEPYIVFENALTYQDKMFEQNDLAEEIETQVRDDFETLISAKNSYLSLEEQVEEAKNKLHAMSIQNKMGLCTFEEYTEMLDQYEELQVDQLTALELWTTLSSSYNRLTCGAVYEYLENQGISLSGGEGGESYVEDDTEKGPKYYIRSILENDMFEIGIYIPDDYETEVTAFEFWVNDSQIGKRTSLGDTIRHLTFTKDNVKKAVIRLYKDDKFVSEAEIDPMTYQGPLDLKGQFVVKEEKKDEKIGSYQLKINERELAELKLEIEPKEDVAFFSLVNSTGKAVLKDDLIDISSTFTYLKFLENSLGDLTIQCYNSKEEKLYDAYFDVNTNSIMKHGE